MRCPGRKRSSTSVQFAKRGVTTRKELGYGPVLKSRRYEDSLWLAKVSAQPCLQPGSAVIPAQPQLKGLYLSTIPLSCEEILALKPASPAWQVAAQSPQNSSCFLEVLALAGSLPRAAKEKALIGCGNGDPRGCGRLIGSFFFPPSAGHAHLLPSCNRLRARGLMGSLGM